MAYKVIMNRSLLFLFLSFAIVFYSCSTTESVTDSPDAVLLDMDDDEIETYLREELSEEDYLLYQSRSFLSDRFANLEHDMPETYLKEVDQSDREIDESQGFRIQILSTRNVAHADSVRDDFRFWSSQRIDNQRVDAYIIFRQPYYRVRVGDFRNRANAIEFSQLIKTRYPEAWVVHDRIVPENVLPDSTIQKLMSTE